MKVKILKVLDKSEANISWFQKSMMPAVARVDPNTYIYIEIFRFLFHVLLNIKIISS